MCSRDYEEVAMTITRSSTNQRERLDPATVWIGNKRDWRSAAALANAYPSPSRGDAERACELSRWRQIWACAENGKFAEARAIVSQLTDKTERKTAEDVVARFETTAGNKRTPLVERRPYIAIACTKHVLPVPKRSLTLGTRAPYNRLVDMTFSIARNYVYNGFEAAWIDFKQVGYVNHGVILITLIAINYRICEHSAFRAFLKEHGWGPASEFGLDLARQLYMRRQREM
jgi:hypothetical protein